MGWVMNDTACIVLFASASGWMDVLARCGWMDGKATQYDTRDRFCCSCGVVVVVVFIPSSVGIPKPAERS